MHRKTRTLCLKKEDLSAMEAIYKEYVTEEFDDKGLLTKIDLRCPEHFNFGFDVLD